MPTEPRVVLVTGASSGIGYATALAFARRGDKVAATARRLDRLEALAAAAKSLLGEIQIYAADVNNPQDMQRVVADVMARWGRLNVLIPNAGLGQRGSVTDSKWEDLELVLRTNIDGVLHTIRAGVPAMRKSGGGQIITISSVVSAAPGAYSAIYSASKSAVDTLTRALRMELAPDNIWVTNILLGQTHSEFAEMRRGRPGRVASKMPTMTPEFVAERIVKESTRRRRTVILRWPDRIIVLVGTFLPWIMDRIMERIYRTS
jgi:short-subunit dehydrogenase